MLRSKNEKLQNKFLSIATQFEELKQDVLQIKDFNRKVRLITNVENHAEHLHLGYGKLSTATSLRGLASLGKEEPRLEENSQNFRKVNFTPSSVKKESSLFHRQKDYEILETNIENLKETGQLIKQETWKIYSSLLEKKDLLNNTPSLLPVKGWITSHYGFRSEPYYADHEPHFHSGTDIAAAIGASVQVPADGCVVYTGYDEHGYGKLLIIDHGYNVKTYYAHLSEIKVDVGACLQRGEIIASVGNTGKSSGPHLHYEVRVLGTPVNPMNYVLDGTVDNFVSY